MIDPQATKPPSPTDLAGRHYLVTGASSGIGQAVAIHLAQLGARLTLTGRDEERLTATASQLAGESHAIRSFDLSDTKATADWMKKLAKDTGPFNGFVHSAGVQFAKPLGQLSRQDLDRVFDVNVHAAIGLARGFSKRSVRQSPASSVFISSVVGQLGQPAISAYCASKGALEAFMRAIALELAPGGVRFNAVAPGYVQTRMAERFFETLTPEQQQRITDAHPLGIGTPADVAYAVAFLLSDAARWITGSTLVVDGGYSAQ